MQEIEMRPSGTTQELMGIAWNGSLFVVVGAAGTIVTSTNSTNWVKRTSGVTDLLTSVACNSNVFVAVGTGGTILTSTNGSNWISRSSGVTNTLRNVAWNGSRFVVVGQAGIILQSEIVVPEPPTMSEFGVEEGGFGFRFPIAAGRTYQIEYSADLANWAILTNLSGEASSTEANFLDDSIIIPERRFYRILLLP